VPQIGPEQDPLHKRETRPLSELSEWPQNCKTPKELYDVSAKPTSGKHALSAIV